MSPQTTKTAKKKSLATKPVAKAATKSKSATPLKVAKPPVLESKKSKSKSTSKGLNAALEEKATVALAASGNPGHDDEDADMDAPPVRGSGKSESAEAMEFAASAAGKSESASLGLKNFRHHPDMENFYRFIHENDLRYDALKLVDEVIAQRETVKTLKVQKSKSH